MPCWKGCFRDRIFELRYEDLVNDQLNTTQSLIRYCNLDWEDNCLDFHDNKRSVTTFSHDQVDKKIYTSSMNRWKNYDKHLNSVKSDLKELIENY